MGIRKATKDDNRQIAKIMSYCFNYGQDFANNATFETDNYLVYEDKNKIESFLSVIPFKMHFYGNFYDMGGIAGVCSTPESRGNGHIADLLKKSFSYQNEKGYAFSALQPFAMSFYRKYGYEWCFAWQQVEFPVIDLKKFKKNGFMKDVDNDYNLIEEIRNKFIENINGPFYHEKEKNQKRYEDLKNSFNHIYISYDENNKENGAIIYKIENRNFIVSEFYYLSYEAKENILSFIYMHSSQIDKVTLTLLRNDQFRNILDNPRIRYWEWPNTMFRIINVEKAISYMKIEDDVSPFSLKVIDNDCPWNNKTFEISNSNNKVKIKETNQEANYEISIQRLSQLVIGFADGKIALKDNYLKKINGNKDKEICKFFKLYDTMVWQSF